MSLDIQTCLWDSESEPLSACQSFTARHPVGWDVFGGRGFEGACCWTRFREPAVSRVTARWQKGHFSCNQPWQETWVTLPISHYNLLLCIRWSMKIHLQQECVYWSHTMCIFTWKRHRWSYLFTLWMCSVF